MSTVRVETKDLAAAPAAAEPALALATTEEVAARLETLAQQANTSLAQTDVAQLHAHLRLAARQPSRALADAIHGLLDDARLTSLTAEGARTLDVLVDALVTMGFPYALEVSPERWEARRKSPRAPADSARIPAWGTLVMGLLSTAFHGYFMFAFGPGGITLPLVWPFYVGLGHALVAVLASTSPVKARSVFRRLGWLGLFGPLCAVICGLFFNSAEAALLTQLFAMPGVLTALASAVTAHRIGVAVEATSSTPSPQARADASREQKPSG